MGNKRPRRVTAYCRVANYSQLDADPLDMQVALVKKPCDRTKPNAVPFMAGRTAKDLNGRKNWICFNNPMLAATIHEKTH